MSERDLAVEFYDEITYDGPDNYADAALIMWDGYPGDAPRERMARVLAFVAAVAIDKVLTRRQREIARTGPWEGGHHFQEEDGYPGSLLPPRGKP
jgi:hypothetical protein